MSEQKHNNHLLLQRVKVGLYLIVLAVTATWALSATINTTKSQVIDLKAQQEVFVSKDLFNAHLQLWDKRFQIMENQLNRVEERSKNIERLLMEQKK